MIRFECPCGAKLKTEDDQAGKIFHCPKCDGRVSVPDKVSKTGVDVGQVFSVDSLKGEEDEQPSETPPELPTVKRPKKEWMDREPIIANRKRTGFFRPYLACRVVQIALKITAGFCMCGIVAIFCLGVYATIRLVMIYVSMGRTADEGLALMPVVLSTCFGLMVAGVVLFALAELLGGFVAFLEKHECYPD